MDICKLLTFVTIALLFSLVQMSRGGGDGEIFWVEMVVHITMNLNAESCFAEEIIHRYFKIQRPTTRVSYPRGTKNISRMRGMSGLFYESRYYTRIRHRLLEHGPPYLR